MLRKDQRLAIRVFDCKEIHACAMASVPDRSANTVKSHLPYGKKMEAKVGVPNFLFTNGYKKRHPSNGQVSQKFRS